MQHKKLLPESENCFTVPSSELGPRAYLLYVIQMCGRALMIAFNTYMIIFKIMSRMLGQSTFRANDKIHFNLGLTILIVVAVKLLNRD